MKAIFLLVTLACSVQLFSQVPNPSFENWQDVQSWEEPVNWETNNGNSFISVTKVDQLTNGTYAMKVESRGPSFEGFAPGITCTSFEPNNYTNAMFLDYRIDSLSGGGNIEIIVWQLANNVYEQIGYWTTDLITTQVKPLLLPYSQLNQDTIKIEIRANSLLSPTGYFGHAEIIVDNIEQGFVDSVQKIKDNSLIKVYPNPSQGNIRVTNCSDCNYSLYAIDGSLINSGKVNNEIILIKDRGVYNLVLDDRETRYSSRVVVEK